MEPQIKSINIHALIQQQGWRIGAPDTPQNPQLPTVPTGLLAFIKPLLEQSFSALLTTNKQPDVPDPSFVFVLKISEEVLELEETKEGRSRIFKLIFGTSCLSLNQRRAMSDDFKVFAERLKILGIHLQKKTCRFWAKGLHPGEVASTEKFRPVKDSEGLSHKTAGSLLQLAQKISIPTPLEKSSSTESALTQLEEIKGMLLDILETSARVVITNSELVKNNDKSIYTFTITAKYANFVERSSVMQNKWELDMVTMQSTLNQQAFQANSADWLSKKIESIAQDLIALRAEIYKK